MGNVRLNLMAKVVRPVITKIVLEGTKNMRPDYRAKDLQDHIYKKTIQIISRNDLSKMMLFLSDDYYTEKAITIFNEIFRKLKVDLQAKYGCEHDTITISHGMDCLGEKRVTHACVEFIPYLRSSLPNHNNIMNLLKPYSVDNEEMQKILNVFSKLRKKRGQFLFPLGLFPEKLKPDLIKKLNMIFAEYGLNYKAKPAYKSGWYDKEIYRGMDHICTIPNQVWVDQYVEFVPYIRK